MKITKKQPLRPRGRSDEKRQSTKDAIREAYHGEAVHVNRNRHITRIGGQKFYDRRGVTYNVYFGKIHCHRPH